MIPREVRADGLFSHSQYPQEETPYAIAEHLRRLANDSGNPGREHIRFFAKLGVEALTHGGCEGLAKVYEQNFGSPPEQPINLQGIDIVCQAYLVGIIEANKHSRDLVKRVKEDFQTED